MRSTTRPTSRRTACAITPATWRWCARASARSRSCWRRRRRRSRPRSTRGAAATRICICRSGSAASICRRSRRSTCTREGPPRGRFIAPRLAEAVKIALERGEQALLFLNRRGFAPLTLCSACGHRLACPNCDAWLVDHRFRRRLVCHHCGFSMPPPEQCPKCEAKGSFVAVGPGVERLEQEAAELFPGARILVLSSDLVESIERLRQELDDVARGPLRHRDRHAARRQGPSFPQAQSGRHRRRRSRPRQRRSARRRAHVPAAASGGRPRRPRGGPRLRLSADAPARASGDARADRAGPRGVLRDRDRGAREDRAIRRSAGSRACSSPAPTSTRPKRYARKLAAVGAASTSRCACSAPPRRRSRWCAGAIASACW